MRSTPTRIGAADAQDVIENLRYLEYRAIVDACDVRSILGEARGESRNGAADGVERIEHQSDLVLQHPVGVVAFLRHGPRIAHHDDGQALLNRFADAAGAGLADEEIGELHEVADLR
jgi:hypothetical protein